MANTTFGGLWGASVTVPAGVTIEVTTNSGGPTTVTMTPEVYDSPLELITEFLSVLTSTRPVTSGAWSATTFTGAGASPQLTLAVSAGTFSITWTSTVLRDLLGFTATITAQSSVTAAGTVRGLWQPDCPLVPSLRHRAAPRITDARYARTPTGIVYAHIGNSRYEHKQLTYSHVPFHKVWRGDELVPNESLQQWLDDTQFGAGHAWFGVNSKCKIYASDGYKVGEDDAVTNWWPVGLTSIQSMVSRVDGWDGLWSVTFPEISADGT